MIPWVLLDTAEMPDGGGDLRLMQRGAEFSIMSGPVELMNSRLSGSEEALAAMAAARLRDRPRPEVLIGGLGMGFTLRAALAALGPEAQVTVAELVPAVMAWARGPLAPVFGDSLADPRVSVVEGDVAGLMAQAGRAYDRLYDVAGLGEARRALRPGGILAVWSSGPDRSFTQRLRRTGFSVDEVSVRASRSRRGARHMIWMATPA